MSVRSTLVLVLHAHLPYIRQPEKPWALEEDWYFEAVTETYIPLIAMIERLAKDNIRPALTISLSPTLCALLEDEVLEKRCRKYITSRLELIEQELQLWPESERGWKTAKMYEALFQQALRVMDKYSGDLVTPFKQFQQNGLIEVITSSATHAVLPLVNHPESVRAQISVAADDYNERFSRRPKGIWLPECAYDSRLPQALRMSSLKYFFTETHGVAFASPRPKAGPYAPLKVPNGLCALGRDPQSSTEVWSSKFGYPGHPDYRDFYRDIGFDEEYDYIKPYLHEDGVRRAVGLKYHKITGPQADKEEYDPEKAAETAKLQAADFLKKRMAKADEVYASCGGIKPVLVGAYDAELFGHWWFEGPQFLEQIIRLIRQERLPLQMATASEASASCAADTAESEPETSSWGEGGYFEPWANNSNDWIYPKINAVAEKMVELANKHKYQDPTPLEKRALTQAARETLLSQNSDWAFLMYVNSHAGFAQKKILEHCDNFNRLAAMIAEHKVDEAALKEMETRHNIFPNLNFKVFTSAPVI